MKAVRTVEDKNAALKERQEEQRALGKHIDRLISEGQISQEATSIGCGGRGVCPAIGRGLARFLGISQRVGAVSTKEMEAVAVEKPVVAAKAKKEHSEITKRVFGVATKKMSPQNKLAAAADAMKARVEALESRAVQSRKSAQGHMRAGNKSAAMRDLKRSKALEKQALSMLAVMDAVETQSDMLEQTALQKEVAAAMGATAATLKKEKNLISKAEDAVDAASEMRDMHDDLSQVMSTLGEVATNDFDDDELMLELQGMTEDPDDPPLAEQASMAEKQAVDEKMELQRQRDYEELERLRQQFPKAPTQKVIVEKQTLLPM